MEYEDFELQIGPRSGKAFLVRVVRSPAGEGETLVELSCGLGREPETEEAVRDLAATAPARQLSPAEAGARLFDAVFSAQVGDLLNQNLSRIGGFSGRGLRIRLRLNPRDSSVAPLQSVPWELLYRRDTEDFLALSRWTPVVRSLNVPRPAEMDLVKPPLRILIVQAPDPRLDLAGELERLTGALRRNRRIEVEVLDSPDISTLRETLHRAPFHILHYMGHATFDSESGEGSLLFRGPKGTCVAVGGQHLATKIKDLGGLRLVVLNACETARASDDPEHSPFSGVATALILSGVPAVVAMQSPIKDADAVIFSSSFYDRLARGRPIEEAMTEGRQAIHSQNPRSGDWAIPVLFLRTPSGDLFVWSSRWKARALVGVLLSLLLLTFEEGSVLQPRPLASPASDPPKPAQRAAIPLPNPAPEEARESLKEPPGSVPASSARSSASIEDPVGRRALPPQARTVGQANGSALRFEIAGDPTYSATFTAALRRAAAPLGTAGGWIARIEIDAPRLNPVVESGVSLNACRIMVTCRLYGHGRSFDLGGMSIKRANADGEAACDHAAEALAGMVARKFAQALKEGLP